MESYKKWVRSNRDYVHSMESLANGMTWLLPERFSASEIGPEAVTAFLGIITTVNQHIIDTAPTHGASNLAEQLFPWSLWVSTLKDLETLVEVAAQQFYGEEKKWPFIAVTEATKALVRLAIFRDSGYKILLRGGEISNMEKGPSKIGNHHSNIDFVNSGRHPSHFQDYYGNNSRNLEGRALYALNKFGENAKMVSDPTWLKRLQHHHSLSVGIELSAPTLEKPTLSTIWSTKGLSGGLFIAAEVFLIMRPLIYVLFIRKYGLRSWIPWLISFGVDLTGHGFLSYAINLSQISRRSPITLSPSEKDEVRRRKLLWLLYLIRDPFFSNYTRYRLDHAEKLLSPVPFVGFLTAKLVELLIGAQTRYTYTAAS